MKWLLRLTLGARITFGMWTLCHAAPQPKTFVLFAGDTDSLEQVSPWIPVRHANRIILRTWSTHLAFGGNADSAKVDSIAIFKVGFSDSVSGYVGSYPVAQDSVVITTTAASNVDSTAKLVGVFMPPLQEALRAPVNGSGIMTAVLPLLPGGVSVWGDGTINTQYMRVYITPLRRNTANGTTSTQGLRANGLRGLKMIATVIYREH